MYPKDKIEDQFTEELLKIIDQNWEWAYGCVDVFPIETKFTEGFVPFNDGGIIVIVKTNFKECPLPVTEETKAVHVEQAKGDWSSHNETYEDCEDDSDRFIDDYLYEQCLFIKFRILYLNPDGNGGKRGIPVTEETVICQAYISFDEYGRDFNQDIVGYGYTGNMTIKGIEYSKAPDNFDPVTSARLLFEFVNYHSSTPLVPQKTKQ